MNGHNKITIIGNLVDTPVLKTYAPGKTLAEFTIAVNNNNVKKTTTYFKATAFAGLGDVATKYQKKGDSVLLDARILVKQYSTKDGTKRQSAELIVNEMLMLGDGSNAGENTAMLAGNLVADPELSSLPNGTAKTKFRMAINNGRRKLDKPEYIDVVLFDKSAENAAKILKKGKGVYVIGRLEAQTFTRKDGTKGDSIAVIATRFQILGSKNGAKKVAETVSKISVFADVNSSESIDDEELPF